MIIDAMDSRTLASRPRGLYLVNRVATRVLMDPPAGSVTCEFAR